MTHHAGDITIRTAEEARRYAAVTSVGGGLCIRADAQLPALTSVGGRAASRPVTVLRKRWTVVIDDTHMQIGCEVHSLADWSAFDDARINRMDAGALRFWRANKAELLALAAGRHTTAEAA